jgi:competence protein ComEC
VIGRALELRWPTALVLAACAGLAASNWLRPPVEALGLVTATAVVVALAVLSSGPRLGALMLILGLAGLAWGGLRLAALEESALERSFGETVRARVVVTGPARRSPFAIRLPAEVRSFDGIPLRERVLLELPPGRAPPQGSILELWARPEAPRGPETGFDERGWLARKGVHVVLRAREAQLVGRRGGIGGVADRLRAHVAAALALGGSGERRAVLAGVVLGDDEGLDDGLRDDFRAAGLYHLLAVSGQNVGFVALGTVGLVWLLGLSRLVGHAAAVATILAYALAVGWQPSVVRAAVAGSLASLAWLASRPQDAWHFLAVGALVLLAWTPASLLEPGFQLSFAAVAAILLSAPGLRRIHAGYPVPRTLVQLVGVAVACGTATAPILWLQFGAVPLWTVVANALAEPAMPPLLGLGLVAALVEPVSPAAAASLSWLAGWCAAWIAFCARLVAGLPHAETSSPIVLAVPVAVVAAVWGLARLDRRRRVRLLSVGAVVAIALAGWSSLRPQSTRTPPNGLRVTFLDVGQGDAALLEVPEGAILVDQGPPEARLADRLHRAGIHALSALVLTHPERDHVGGAADVLRRLEVDAVLDPDLAVVRTFGTEALGAARAHGVPVHVARSGQVYRLGRLVLRVLWPEGQGAPSANPNELALIMLASYGATDVLLTADAESQVQRRLALRPIEVLKVAHHGSEDEGLPGVLAQLRPQVAVISVGRENDYGHPRPETIAALESVAGIRLYRTDVDGAVMVESDGRTFSVRSGARVP